MLHWEKEYRRKTVTAEQAAALIKSGDRIMAGNRYTLAIMKALFNRMDLKDVIYYAPIINHLEITDAIGNGIRPMTSFMNENSREMILQDRADFIPGEYWNYDKITRHLGCTIALIEATKPDAHGYMSMGTSCDMIREASKHADLVIVETNSEFPFVMGGNLIHISEVDYVVDEGENFPWPSTPINMDESSIETYKAVGAYLSELIPDEATIEVGLGRLNTSSMMFMENKKDLGVHTEVYGDILMNLTEKGMITNAAKSLDRGKSVFTQMVGTQEMFDWATNNPGISQEPCQYALNPGTIAAQHRMTAINNGVEVDLVGQVNAEYLKGAQYSGMGGILNFASGATACPDGKSIVVLESATRNGKFSKITPAFKPGTPVSLPRTVVEYVVTEYGIAKLGGKSPKARAQELINVAHPKFREELTAQAKEMGIL